MTLFQLEELTGWLAAESNHANSRRVSEELGEICDQVESLLDQIKRGWVGVPTISAPHR